MESEEEEREDTRTPMEVWDDYVKDQLGWLEHFYRAAGEKGNEPFQKAKKAFKELEEKLKSSHYNKNDNYFKTFAKLQGDKYYRKKPYSTKDIKGMIDIKNLSKIQKKAEAQSQMQINNVYDNYKAIIKYLTQERYNMNNVAKHIFREEKEQIEKDGTIRSFTFDVQRGKKIDWKQYGSESLFYLFLKSVSKGIMELQAKKIFHLDLRLRNILLFGIKDLGDLSDHVKIATNNELMFKINDFDNALLIGKDYLEKTLTLLQNISFIQNTQLINDRSLLKENPIKDMEERHASQFAICLDNILQKVGERISLSEQEKLRLRDMILGRKYQELIKIMEEKISKSQSTN